jgi:ABC-type transport system substrate-binding protein
MTTIDPKQRANIWSFLSPYLHYEAPWIELYDQEEIYGVSKRVKHWKPPTQERIFYYQVDMA